jgi:hypothetical protein
MKNVIVLGAVVLMATLSLTSCDPKKQDAPAEGETVATEVVTDTVTVEGDTTKVVTDTIVKE